MLKIIVAGDLMLDVYVRGRNKDNPELKGAPNLGISGLEYRLGGAANVARNLSVLGSDVFLIGKVGVDREAEKIKRLMERDSIPGKLLIDPEIKTTTKVRILHEGEGGYNYGRLNYEGIFMADNDGINENLFPPRVITSKEVDEILEYSGDARVIVFSDYDKGMAEKRLIRELIARGIPIIADIKPPNKALFIGSYLIKPNSGEALKMTGLEDDIQAAKALRDELETRVLLTRSKKGVFYTSNFGETGEEFSFPTNAVEVRGDTTGCGDNVIATYAHFRFTRGYNERKAVRLANIAAGIATQHVGCYPPTEQEILKLAELT